MLILFQDFAFISFREIIITVSLPACTQVKLSYVQGSDAS